MIKKQELISKLLISKKESYRFHRCLLNLDKEREDKFNKGEQIEVTSEELNTIGTHRWLEVKSGS